MVEERHGGRSASFPVALVMEKYNCLFLMRAEKAHFSKHELFLFLFSCRSC